VARHHHQQQPVRGANHWTAESTLPLEVFGPVTSITKCRTQGGKKEPAIRKTRIGGRQTDGRLEICDVMGRLKKREALNVGVEQHRARARGDAKWEEGRRKTAETGSIALRVTRAACKSCLSCRKQVREGKRQGNGRGGNTAENRRAAYCAREEASGTHTMGGGAKRRKRD